MNTYYVASYIIRADGSRILPPIITAGPGTRKQMERDAERHRRNHPGCGDYQVRSQEELRREEADRLEKAKGRL